MDQWLFHLINERWTHPALDLFMAAISDIEIWKPLLILLGLCILIFAGFKGRAFIICLVLALVVADYFLVSTLKRAIDRRRPKQVQKSAWYNWSALIRNSLPCSRNPQSGIRTKPIATNRVRRFPRVM